MNGTGRPPRRPADSNLTADENSASSGGRPRLELVLELEEFPVARLVAQSHEDERRLMTWLDRADRRRLHAHLDEILDGVGRAA